VKLHGTAAAWPGVLGAGLIGAVLIGAALTGAAAANTVLVDANAAYPEGPLWRDGKLLYVEYAGPGIKMWDGQRATPYWSGSHCGASGLIAFRGDHILVACYDANTLVELDRAGKEIRSIDQDGAGRPFVGPNDFTADRAGGIYVSASGVYDLKAPISGTVLYLSAAGVLTEVANLIHYSNGLTLSKDGKQLLVAECRRLAGSAHGVGAAAGPGAADRSRRCVQRPRRVQTRTRRQLLYCAERLGPRAGGER
jgi:sugar lactone lactonase YvrE